MTNVLNQIREENSKLEKLRKQVQESNKSLLGQAVKQIFEENEDWLESFSWTQYTPYFNDGNTCYFGVNLSLDCGTKVNGEYVDEIDYLSEQVYQNRVWLDNPNYDAAKTQAIKDLIEIINSVGEDTLKSIFGDHVEVVLTKNGFEVNDYSDHY